MGAIQEAKIGSVSVLTLVVRSATARKTKAGKDFLVLNLFDGTDAITGNYWDWTSGKMPEPNTVVDVTAQVTEWQGAKQLNVTKVTVNTEVPVSVFAPRSEYDIDSIYNESYALMCDVKDGFLRDLALNVLEVLKNKWLTVPGAKSVHHAFVGGTLVHSYHVSRIAKSIAEVSDNANVDLCTVGGFLHDVGKLFTYTLNGTTIDMTSEGMLYEHLFIGAEFIGNLSDELFSMDSTKDRKMSLLRHIILSHHQQLEYGSPVTPQSIEAFIVAHADAIDAATEQIREASAKVGNVKFTDRIWALGNRPCLTTQFVEKVMQPPTVEENNEATSLI